jgi:hypothetical protein
MLSSFETGKDGPKRPRSHRLSAARRDGEPATGPPGQSQQGILILLAVVLLASVLLGVLAFGRSASRTVTEDIGYKQTGEFGYSANVPSGLYDSTDATTGQPMFRRLTDKVNIHFDYQLTSDRPTADVEGTHQLVAQLSTDNGWKRTIPLEPATRFTGGEFTTHATLDLSTAQRIIDELEKRTEVRTDRYALSVVPEVYTRGTLAGHKLNDEFSPRMDFWLDSLQLQLQSPDTVGAETSDEAAVPLKSSEEGLFKASKTEPNSISIPILGFGLSVSVARVLSVLGLALSVGGLLWFGIPLLRAPAANEPARIRSRYEQVLVSMSGDLEAYGRMIEVLTFEDLAKIADKTGQSILHRTSDGVHHYYVQDIGMTYHYRIAGQETQEAASTNGAEGR